MPHIIVKLYAGRTEEQKKALTGKLVRDVIDHTGCSETAVSVAFEEYAPEDWPEQVYKKDILNGSGKLYKSPGYDPFAEDQGPTESQDLMAFVRGASERAAMADESGMFNPMSWLDLELEDSPGTFDPCFDTPWNELSDNEKTERMKAIRRVL
ncbi:MAG: tautomerase family protein [Desulfobacter sp.]|nr:MAG: tautomerase family protein [Desulfobacter sp.]